MVVHNWRGFGANNAEAEKLAQLGYVAFAVDIYGKGVRPQNTEEAGQQAGIYKSDRKLFRERLSAGLEAMKNFSLVDKNKMAAIGYCFGGTGVMELARSGADVKGVVSFHGGLDSPTPEDGKNIKAKVLALHGADDPFVPESDLKAFEDELKGAGVDYQIVKYSQAKHAFTDKGADDDGIDGTAYNAAADARSWQAMKDFFNEIFR
jgi:dienelactone hydrolase